MSYFFPTCKEASELAIRGESAQLSFLERLRLRLHMAICEVCQAFAQQMMVISKSAQRCECNAEMSADCQQRIRENLLKEMQDS